MTTEMLAPGQWPADRAARWVAERPWYCGCNFLLSTAVIFLEMWRADTFDRAMIERELGWAVALGLNAVRTNLHYLVWRHDRDGLLARIDEVPRHRDAARPRDDALVLRRLRVWRVRAGLWPPARPVSALAPAGRPIFCTEWMARAVASRVADQLEPMRRRDVGGFHWGLVRDRTQTDLPWPEVLVRLCGGTYDGTTWFHDLLDADGSPHDPNEVEDHPRRHPARRDPRRKTRRSARRGGARGLVPRPSSVYSMAARRGVQSRRRGHAQRGGRPMSYTPDPQRYDRMVYRRCGRSGLKLPAVSLGLWHNFGHDTPHQRKRAICRSAFDHGITHFDLANNYGPPYGSAEEAFGEVLRTDFAGYRDELIISSKAGYDMWPGPYGEWGSRKYLIASCDQSLKRMGLDYVDIFYSHRFDPETPLEETMGALDTIVRSGRALYAGISSYNSERTREAARILAELGTPCLIHQPAYNMLNRWVERDGLKETLQDLGIGSIAFTPLAQGMLTTKYLGGVPEGSRAAQDKSLDRSFITDRAIEKIRALNAIAERRGQTLAQMAIAWVLRDGGITTALIGASRPEQVVDCAGAIGNLEFTADELAEIDEHASDEDINLWARSAEIEA